MKIAVTDCGNAEKQRIYVEWLRSYRPEAEIITLSYRDDGVSLTGCDGLVLTGGEDVDPALSKAAPAELVETTDRRRDDFEFALLQQSMDAALPVFGICRGLQVANVFFGGTLIADLPSAGFQRHTAAKGSPALRHTVQVRDGSLLRAVTSAAAGDVNSYHHQSVLAPADVLTVSATSDDGVVEALEWKEPNARPFLLLVQWHPERMTDRANPFTSAVVSAFFAETEQYHHTK
jgi:putative glutamine amidotransferase